MGAKRCPTCGEGILTDILYNESSVEVNGEELQEGDSREVEIYSCGHEVVGPRMDETSSASELDVEHRSSEETVDPL